MNKFSSCFYDVLPYAYFMYISGLSVNSTWIYGKMVYIRNPLHIFQMSGRLGSRMQVNCHIYTYPS